MDLATGSLKSSTSIGGARSWRQEVWFGPSQSEGSGLALSTCCWAALYSSTRKLTSRQPRMRRPSAKTNHSSISSTRSAEGQWAKFIYSSWRLSNPMLKIWTVRTVVSRKVHQSKAMQLLRRSRKQMKEAVSIVLDINMNILLELSLRKAILANGICRAARGWKKLYQAWLCITTLTIGPSLGWNSHLYICELKVGQD